MPRQLLSLGEVWMRGDEGSQGRRLLWGVWKLEAGRAGLGAEPAGLRSIYSGEKKAVENPFLCQLGFFFPLFPLAG